MHQNVDYDHMFVILSAMKNNEEVYRRPCVRDCNEDWELVEDRYPDFQNYDYKLNRNKVATCWNCGKTTDYCTCNK